MNTIFGLGFFVLLMVLCWYPKACAELTNFQQYILMLFCLFAQGYFMGEK